MEAGKRTLNDIFNGNRVLEIPFFQRSYVWGEEQWQRLLEDMEKISQSSEKHFIGSIILKQKETSTENGHGDIRTVVDGQQRLTTLNIFFKVLCFLENNETAFDRIFRLIDRNNIALKHNHNDLEAFNRIVNLKSLEELDFEDSITKAYNFFKEKIDPDKLDFNKILNGILFVGIDLAHDEDEQQIFDTINSLGVKLTTSELLKNYFFDRDDIQFYEENWKEVFELNEEVKEYWDRTITTGRVKRTSIDLFFYSFLQIKIQEGSYKINTEDKKEFSRVDKLFESYKKFVKEYYDDDKKDLVKEIKVYALLFKKIFDPEIVSQPLSENCGIETINLLIFGLDTSTLVSYILYVEKNQPDKDIKNNLYKTIESFIMRRMVSKVTAKNYNQLFTERLIHNKVLSKEMFIEYIDGQNDTLNYWPSDEEVENSFLESKLTNKQASGILYLVESKLKERFHSTQLLGFNKYSLEHLMPKKWENHWGMPNHPYTPEDRNNILLTLGNLTIITQSLNSSIRDSEWSQKLNGNENRAGLKQYADGIETIKEYLDYPKWDENTIKQRADYLSKKAISIWSK